MYFENRNRVIRSFNLNNNMNIFVLAKTLFATCPDGEDQTLIAIANVAINRFIYEFNIDDETLFIKSITDHCIFDCWNDYKNMEAINLQDLQFKLCFSIAKKILCGKMDDNSKGSINFHKKNKSPIWATGLESVAEFSDFLFFNNCD